MEKAPTCALHRIHECMVYTKYGIGCEECREEYTPIDVLEDNSVVKPRGACLKQNNHIDKCLVYSSKCGRNGGEDACRCHKCERNVSFFQTEIYYKSKDSKQCLLGCPKDHHGTVSGTCEMCPMGGLENGKWTFPAMSDPSVPKNCNPVCNGGYKLYRDQYTGKPGKPRCVRGSISSVIYFAISPFLYYAIVLILLKMLLEKIYKEVSAKLRKLIYGQQEEVYEEYDADVADEEPEFVLKKTNATVPPKNVLELDVSEEVPSPAEEALSLTESCSSTEFSVDSSAE